MEKSIKEKRLEIFSLAMDINEKFGAMVFVTYFPHTDWLEINIHKIPWTISSNKDFKSYIIDDSKMYGEISHDEMILKLEKMLSNEK